MRERRIGGGTLACACALALLTALAAAGFASALERKLIVPGGVAGDRLSAVAVDGNRLVLASPIADGGRGAAYLFTRTGDSWGFSARLTASDRAADDQLGASVAIDGDVIVAGAPGDNDDRGSAYTFALTGAPIRTETAKLTASDGTAFDKLGQVAIDGQTIVAGAPGDEAGSVYTFARTGATARTQTAKLTASDGASGDDLGGSVAIDGNAIVAGASFDTIGTASFQGSVYTFAATGAPIRTETAKLTASDGAATDFLGSSVAIEGGTIAAGLAGDEVDGDPDRGSVYTFAATGAPARTETAKLTASDGAANDGLGNGRIAIDGGTIVAGAPYDDNGARTNEGSVYTFAATGAAVRTETGKLNASDGAGGDLFGSGAAIAGTTILAVSPDDDVGTKVDQGSATAFFDAAPLLADTKPPETSRIKGPKKVKRGKRARFKFSSNEAGSAFTCKLDKKRAKPCASPFKLKTKRLKARKHTLSVYATDAAGNVDPTPSKRRFKVVRSRR